jgi:hypothetical protein
MLSAYNEVFAKTGYATISFEVVADIHMPINDANALMITVQWWVPNFWPGCCLCSNFASAPPLTLHQWVSRDLGPLLQSAGMNVFLQFELIYKPAVS